MERDAKGLDAQTRLTPRQERSRPLLDQPHAWLLDEEKDAVLPKSPMGGAIGYALNNWDALVRYATDPSGGDLAIDNNAAERAIRPLVTRRRH